MIKSIGFQVSFWYQEWTELQPFTCYWCEPIHLVSEFWEDHFHCKYPNSSRTPYNIKYNKMCTTKEKLTKSNTMFEAQLQFVSDAVMAFAHAFKDMHKELCNGKPGLCSALKPIKGTELLKYLRKIKFTGEFSKLYFCKTDFTMKTVCDIHQGTLRYHQNN